MNDIIVKAYVSILGKYAVAFSTVLKMMWA